MSDVESDYSSSSEEDDDYVPSEDEESGDDLEGAVVEEDEGEEGEGSRAKKPKAKGKKELKPKRKGWSALADDESNKADPEAEQRMREEEEFRKAEAAKKDEEEKKKKADDLWSSFLSDVGKRPKPTKDNAPSKAKPEKVTATPTSDSKSNGNSTKKTVQVTQVLDFAGEEIRVTKELDLSSSEGKKYLKQQEKTAEGESSASSSPLSLLKTSNTSLPKPGGLAPLKRPGAGLGNVLGQIGKKKKMSVLDKSKLDWDSFKTSEGITEELKIHNKGKEGFVEKQRFLQRTDVREYEKERDLRLAQSKINR